MQVWTLLAILGGAVVAMTIVCLIPVQIYGDASWYLYAAGRVLDGAHVGETDLVDVNPPLIIWLSLIPAALSRALGVLPQTGLRFCLAALAAISTVWCGSLVRRCHHDNANMMAVWLAIVILWAATAYPWNYLGEREQILILLVLPYLVAAAMRVDGMTLKAWEGIAIGLLAAVGFSLKVQHLGVVAGVELLLTWHLGWQRSTRRPELLALILGGLAYALAVLIFATDYVTKIVPLAYHAYLDYDRQPLAALLEPGRFVKIAGLTTVFLALRRRLLYRSLGDIFIIAALGFTLGYLIQEKGWQYQFIPASACYIILVGVMASEVLSRWAALRQQRLLSHRALTTVAIASTLVIGALYYPLHAVKARDLGMTDRVVAQRTITSSLPAGTMIFVLGPGYGTIFDFVLDYHLKWGSRFIGLWTLPEIFQKQQAAAESSGTRQPTPLVQWTWNATVEDLQRWKPSVVLVERCQDPATLCGGLESTPIDMLRWFGQDPAFVSVWSNYVFGRRIGYYDIWCLKNEQAVCE
jgi:hypothetical protein